MGVAPSPRRNPFPYTAMTSVQNIRLSWRLSPEVGGINGGLYTKIYNG